MAQFYYGKYLLPEIPVLEGYPYIVIRKNEDSGNFELIFFETYCYYEMSNKRICYNSMTTKKSQKYKLPIDLSVTEWEYEKENTNVAYTIDESRIFVWCNEDILQDLTTIVWAKGHPSSTEAYDYLVYNSVESIFDVGTRSMQCLVNNVSYDNNSYSISSVPSWLKFNNIVPSTIYVNGNSWIGFSGSTESIMFNRRDTKMWYLWVEEGKLYNYYNFYRIRWRGYSQNNVTTEDGLQDWEVIFFDTGDICIHANCIPISNYGGINSLVASETYNYQQLTVENPIVTFYTKDENNTIFKVEQSIIRLFPPCDKKFLIMSEGILYTIVDGGLSQIEETEVNSNLFINKGSDIAPTGEMIKKLIDPEILYWGNTEDFGIETIEVIENATPFTQVVESVDYSMMHPSILGIEKVIAEAEGDVRFAVSFDRGITWKIWTGTAWGILSELDTGMSLDVINSINSEQWSLVATTGWFRFRAIIKSTSDVIKSFVVDYLNV